MSQSSGLAGAGLGGLSGGGDGANANATNTTLLAAAAGAAVSATDSSDSLPLIAGAGGAAVFALALLLGVWLLALRRRRRRREDVERQRRLNRSSFAAKAGKLGGTSRSAAHVASTLSPRRLSMKPPGTGAAADGGLALRVGSGNAKSGVGAAVFSQANPALAALRRPRASTASAYRPLSVGGGSAASESAAAGAGAVRPPRLSVALAGMQPPVAARSRRTSTAQPRASIARARVSIARPRASLAPRASFAATAAAALQHDDAAQQLYSPDNDAIPSPAYDDAHAATGQSWWEGVAEEEPPATLDAPDYHDDGDHDEADAVHVIGARKAGAAREARASRTWAATRAKKAAPAASAPAAPEPKKLVIGSGAIVQEKVEKQVVRLRRVSKIKGDSSLTQARQAAAIRDARSSVVVPSAAAGGSTADRASSTAASLAGLSYAFAETVGRAKLRVATERSIGMGMHGASASSAPASGSGSDSGASATAARRASTMRLGQPSSNAGIESSSAFSAGRWSRSSVAATEHAQYDAGAGDAAAEGYGIGAYDSSAYDASGAYDSSAYDASGGYDSNAYDASGGYDSSAYDASGAYDSSAYDGTEHYNPEAIAGGSAGANGQS